MREIEFLPEWYPQVRRARLAFVVQLWALGAVLVGAALYALFAHGRVGAARAAFVGVTDDLALTRAQVKELDQQVQLQKTLLTKQRLVGELGMPVELSRAITEIALCMPMEMSLDEMTFLTTEQDLSIAAQAARAGAKHAAASAKSRTLSIVIKGVAPTESQVTSFYSELSNRRFFDNVSLKKSFERRSGDRVMREFEIAFEIPLDYQASAAAAAQ